MLDMTANGAYHLLHPGKREAPENEAMEAREEQVPLINIWFTLCKLVTYSITNTIFLNKYPSSKIYNAM